MTAVIDFLVPALLVSGTALILLNLTPAIPPPIRLTIALVGMLAWFVPWPWISLPGLSAAGTPVIDWSGEGAAQLSSIRENVVATVGSAMPAISAVRYWWLLFVPGLIWFAADIAAYTMTVGGWRRHSRCGRRLACLMAKAPGDADLTIRVVAESSVAVAVGWLRPTIFIGERLCGDETLRVALTHEACHIRRRDPLRMWLITLIARLYCFNPLVLALKRQSVLAIEAGCDEECARRLGRRRYLRTLARLTLEGQRGGLVPAPALQTPSLNLARLRLLDRSGSSRSAVGAAVVLLIAACLAGVAWGSSQPLELRIGDWIEATDSSRYGYDVTPVSRSFQRLDNGMVRAYQGDAGWTDFRCDGREYRSANARGQSGQTQACSPLDRWTNRYVIRRVDGSSIVSDVTETLSRDGQTLELITTDLVEGRARESRRTFFRIR